MPTLTRKEIRAMRAATYFGRENWADNKGHL